MAIHKPVNKKSIYFITFTCFRWQPFFELVNGYDLVYKWFDVLKNFGNEVLGYVIMPNHIHLIWRINEPNGKESPQGSFLKYTAHIFKKMLRDEGRLTLEAYGVDAENKKYEFWQRDSLAIPLFTRKVAIQKLNYIHNNPLKEHWNLVKHPCDYKYSSARYYEMNEKDFSFLKDLWEVVGRL